MTSTLGNGARTARAISTRSCTGEERPLGLAGRHPDDDVVEQVRGAPHEVLVAAGERVERAGVDDLEHGWVRAGHAEARTGVRRAGADGKPPAPRARRARARRPRRRRQAACRLGIDRAAVRDKPRGARDEQPRPGVVGEGRVAEDHVEAARRRARGRRGRRRGPRRDAPRRRAASHSLRSRGEPADRARRPSPMRRPATAPRARARRCRRRGRASTSPVRSCPSQLNSVSRTRSGVGRSAAPAGKRIARPRQRPPMMRTALAVERDKGQAGRKGAAA